jgi:hypothetical protein
MLLLVEMRLSQPRSGCSNRSEGCGKWDGLRVFAGSEKWERKEGPGVSCAGTREYAREEIGEVL